MTKTTLFLTQAMLFMTKRIAEIAKNSTKPVPIAPPIADVIASAKSAV